MRKPTENTTLLHHHNDENDMSDKYGHPVYSRQFHFTSSIRKKRKRRIQMIYCLLCTLIWCILIVASSILLGIYYLVPFIRSIQSNNAYNISRLVTVASRNDNFNSFPIRVPLNEIVLAVEIVPETDTWFVAHKMGENALSEMLRTEVLLPTLTIDSPSYRHQMAIATSEFARRLSRIGYLEGFATRFFHSGHGIELGRSYCLYRNTSSTTSICAVQNTHSTCDPSNKFRKYDGTCNNYQFPWKFGVAHRPFRRILPANYADGISVPRLSKIGDDLPSARVVSLIVHRRSYQVDRKFSVMLAVWGQFLDHDITATALSRKANGDTIACCSTFNRHEYVSHPECYPVALPKFDPLYLKYNITCMEFVRSAPAATGCYGPREQINQATAFIDGSGIYGNDAATVRSLRSFSNGELKMFTTLDNRTLLPVSDDYKDGCNRREENQIGRYCFLTGDRRSNENLHLTSMHLIWARQHNLLAQRLTVINPHWNDERIFQEVRRLIGAQMQHITYSEFLPILLGDSLMNQYGLTTTTYLYQTYRYNGTLDPSIANSFATATFRFAHSILPGLIKFLANQTSSPEFVEMHRMLFNPFQLYAPGELDATLRSAIETHVETSDAYFSAELKNHLFERNFDTKENGNISNGNGTVNVKRTLPLCGLDLVTLNIQRGRDHGLNSYNKWREHCGLKQAKTFDELGNDLDADSLRNIKSVYRNVDDIDLYTGAMSETPLENSILGPTITCLIMDQFYRLKFGDRFWYESTDEHVSFTIDQLREIRTTTLAKIICDNADSLKSINMNVMKINATDNRLYRCSDLPTINLQYWAE